MSEFKFKEEKCSILNSLTTIKISKEMHKRLNNKIDDYVNSIIPDPMFYFPVQETNTLYNETLDTHVNEVGIKMMISKPHSIIRDLVMKAISESPTQMLKSQHIYQILHKKYPYFRYCISTSQAHWRSSIRHALSNHESFNNFKVVSPGRNCTWLYWGIVRGIQPQSYQALTLLLENFIPADSPSDLSQADIKITIAQTETNNYETVAFFLSENPAEKIGVVPSLQINTESNKNHSSTRTIESNPSENYVEMISIALNTEIVSVKPVTCVSCPGRISLVPIKDDTEVLVEEYELMPNENLIRPIQVIEDVITGNLPSNFIEEQVSEADNIIKTEVPLEPIKIKLEVSEHEPQLPLKDHHEFFSKTDFTNQTTPVKSNTTESLYNKVSVSPSRNIRRKFGVNLTNSGILKCSPISPFSPSSPVSRRKVSDPLLSFTQSKKKKCSRKLHLSEDEGSSEEEERAIKSKKNEIDKTLGVFLKNKRNGTLLSPKGNSEKTVYLSLPFTHNELEPVEEMDHFGYFKDY